MAIRSPNAVTPILRRALQSFGRARAAIVAGQVDEMIGHLTRGAALVEAIDREAKAVAKRSPKRRSAS